MFSWSMRMKGSRRAFLLTLRGLGVTQSCRTRQGREATRVSAGPDQPHACKSSTTRATRQVIVYRVTLRLGPCITRIYQRQNHTQRSQRTIQSTDGKFHHKWRLPKALRKRRRLWTTAPRRLSRLRVKMDVTHMAITCSPFGLALWSQSAIRIHSFYQPNI